MAKALLKNFLNQTSVAERSIAVNNMLVKDEELLVQAVIHRAIYWKSGALLVFSLFLALAIPVLGALLGFFGLVFLSFTILTKHFLLLALTNKRVMARYGVLQTEIVNINFAKIESVELEQMLLGHILGYANVIVMGTGNRYIRIPYIANATEFRKKYDELTLQTSQKEET